MKRKFLPSDFGFVASAILFAFSATQNGFCVQNSSNCWPGYFLVPLGWLEFVAIKDAGPFPILAWAANPLWLMAIAAGFRRDGKSALYLSLAAVALGSTFFLAKGVAVSEAGGAPYPVTVYGPGLWLWLSSFVLAAASSLVLQGAKKG